jgi:hypothetical protein
MKKKLCKTVIIVEVISAEAFEFNDLSDIHYQIIAGYCSGDYRTSESTWLTGKEAADAVIAQGSYPEFFGIDEDGNDLFEE